MSQSLKVIKNRIKSVGNTQRVTNVMQMVSLSKLNRAAKILYAIRPYSLKVEELLNNLVAFKPEARHPLLEKRIPPGKKVLCVITSDNGLCGFYNTGILRLAEDFIARNGRENVMVVAVGRRGYSFLKNRSVMIHDAYLGLNGRYDSDVADKISKDLIKLFLENGVDEVWCAHAHFETSLIQNPSLEKIIPVEPKSVLGKEYILEPEAGILLNELIFEGIIMKIRRIIIEGFTAEHASRVIAMKLATDSAQELLGNLTLVGNKIRQSTITQDIMEIISSAEALKG